MAGTLSEYFMNPFQTSTLITAVTGIILGGFVIFGGGKEWANRYWAITTCLLGLWSLGLFGVVSSTTLQQALFWQKVLDASAILIPVLFFLFVLALIKKESLHLLRITAIIVGILLFALSFTHWFKNGMAPIMDFPYWVVPGPLYILFPATYLFFFAVSLYLLLAKHLTTDDKKLKLQIRYILAAQIFGFGGGLTNFFPQLFKVYPIGNYFIIFYLFFISYSILKNNLFNIKVIATEFFIYAIWIFLFARVLLASTLRDRLVESGLLLALVFFGIFLIRSVRREVQQREQLEKLTQDLSVANDQLQELSKFKSQLLSLASHQLKSPMAAIKGFATILIEGLYGPISDKVKETIEKMRKSADDQLNLINTLLDLRRVEEGKMEYQFATTDLKQIVSEKLDELKLLATQKGIELNFETEPQPIWVSADGPKLKQVIQNFVDNAIKYTPKGFVHVTLHTDGEYTIFSVIDSGLGIPAELLPHLFEEFVRDERVKAQILGTGFGLYIAKKIMEAHGGTVWAESDGPNKGSKFSFKLRMVPQAEIQKQARLAVAGLTNKNNGI